MKNILPLLAVIIFALSSTGCNKAEAEPHQEQYHNLNVTILLDLSDRISKTKNPGQAARDTAAVMQVVRSFKSHIRSKGIVHTDDKIRVIFYPSGSQELVHRTAAELSIDFSLIEGEAKRRAYEMMDSIYSTGLGRIYDAASSAASFDGSDLFSFFSYRAKDDCISDLAGSKNILVILSDGYLYHKNNMLRSGNRFSYIGPESQHLKMFRGNHDWQKQFSEGDYGFLKTGAELDGLYILLLEVRPAEGHVRDYEVLRGYWGRWFEEMGVTAGNYKIIQTDLPSQNVPLIARFVENTVR